jgi:hypothetical protein
LAGGPDTQLLKTFRENVLTHVAAVATQERRHRYWEPRIFPTGLPAPGPEGHEPIKGLPPADTSVLLGFVRSDEQLEWVLRTRLYNMRADTERNGSVTVGGREASAQILVLYAASKVLGAWRLSGLASVLTGAQLLSLGYPSPHGEAYVCVHLVETIRDELGPGIDYQQIARLAGTAGRPFGSPALVSWAALTGGSTQ